MPKWCFSVLSVTLCENQVRMPSLRGDKQSHNSECLPSAMLPSAPAALSLLGAPQCWHSVLVSGSHTRTATWLCFPSAATISGPRVILPLTGRFLIRTCVASALSHPAFKMLEKWKCRLFASHFFSPWNGDREELNQGLGSHPLICILMAVQALNPAPEQGFVQPPLGRTQPFPAACPAGSFWSPSLAAPSWSLSSSTLSHSSNNAARFHPVSASAVRVKPTLPRDSRLSTTPGLSGLWLAVLPRGQSKALF